jgi:hypothetical protein
MAEILIKAVDAVHSDPEKDRRGCYKRGMPVVVQPDGHQWGSAEGLPNFVVLKLPGVPVKKARKFIDQDMIDDGLEEDGITPKKVTYRRRLWQIQWNDLPVGARNKLLADGEITIGPLAQGADYTWAQFRNFLKNLRTDAIATADELD